MASKLALLSLGLSIWSSMFRQTLSHSRTKTQTRSRTRSATQEPDVCEATDTNATGCVTSELQHDGDLENLVATLAAFDMEACMSEDAAWIARRGEGEEQFLPRAWGLEDLRRPKQGDSSVAAGPPDRSEALARLSPLVKNTDREVAFRAIYSGDIWGSGSGPGSSLVSTSKARCALEALHSAKLLRSLWDVCGSFTWIRAWLERHREVRYEGADIVPELIARLQKRYGRPSSPPSVAAWTFVQADVVCGEATSLSAPHGFDVVLLREVFQHQSPAEVLQSLRCVSNSGARWLLATNFPGRMIIRGEYKWNTDQKYNLGLDKNAEQLNDWRWHAYDLVDPPYSLPTPLWTFYDDGKQLGLWRLPLSL